jgi:glycosyltransferase involved in cell wall biosynthesis
VVNRGAISIENFKPKKMIYYSHDNTDAPVMKGIEEFFEKPDVIVAVSEWHKTRLLDLAWEKGVDLRPEKIVVVGNGLAFPPSRVVLKDFAACYCSIPFKGLHVLATIWPRIKEAVPGLKLHVCSGMSMYGMDSHDMYYENVYEALRADPDVVFHGVLTNEGVRDVMAGCSLMIYPNTFPETFCVAAYESISVGTPVISSDLAALPTTVADCGVLIKGDPEFPGMATKTAYHEEMISVLKDILVDHPEKLDLLRLKCYDRKMRTWKDVADDLERISMEALNGN